MQKFHVTILEPYRLVALRPLPRREVRVTVSASSGQDAATMAGRVWRRWFDQDVPARAQTSWRVDPDAQARLESLRYAALRHDAASGRRRHLTSAERASATHSGIRRVSKATGVERDWRGRDRQGFSGLGDRHVRPAWLAVPRPAR